MSLDLVLSLQKQNRLLKGALTLASLGLAAGLLIGAKAPGDRTRFTEIDAERINLVDAAGKVSLVLAGRGRLPKPIVDGKELPSERGQVPGLVFYNASGDECGGLIFDGKLDGRGHPVAGTHFSMDRFGGDQQLVLGHHENGGFMETGLNVYDRGLAKEYDPLFRALNNAKEGPEKEALKKRWEEAGGRQTPRLFVGRTRGRSSAVILADAQGHPRITMMVSPEGQPTLTFLDGDGRVLQNLPEKK